MALDVKIHRNSTPKFPPACVKCGETPTTSVKVGGDTLGWFSILRVGRIYGGLTGRTFEVPACEVCAKQIDSQRWKRKLVEFFILLIGVGVGTWLFHDWDGLAKKVAVVGVGLVAVLPWLWYEHVHPAAVAVTVMEESVTFHFADDDYAQEFADRNPTL